MQYARLKTYNGKQNVLRSFTVFGIKFQEKNGWYEVEDDVAEYLKTCTQIQEDPTSAKAFHVVETMEEAEEIDDLERKRAERAKAAEAHPTAAKRVHTATARNRSASGDLTTKDLQKPAEGRRSKGFDDMKDTFDDDMSPRAKSVTPVLDGADDEDDDTASVQKSDEETDDEETEDTEVEDTEAAPASKPNKTASRGRGRK